jgi:hypothetical protein
MDEEYKAFFPDNEINGAKKFISFFHRKLLLNENLSDADAILLLTYMLSNKNKNSEVKSEEVMDLFVKSGRNKSNFSKRIHRLIKGGRKGDILKENDRLSLTFTGLTKVKEMLKQK